MPFKKVKGGYKSPSGKKYTSKQVKLYYALGGKFPKKTKRKPKK